MMVMFIQHLLGSFEPNEFGLYDYDAGMSGTGARLV